MFNFIRLPGNRLDAPCDFQRVRRFAQLVGPQYKVRAGGRRFDGKGAVNQSAIVAQQSHSVFFHRWTTSRVKTDQFVPGSILLAKSHRNFLLVKWINDNRNRPLVFRCFLDGPIRRHGDFTHQFPWVRRRQGRQIDLGLASWPEEIA